MNRYSVLLAIAMFSINGFAQESVDPITQAQQQITSSLSTIPQHYRVDSFGDYRTVNQTEDQIQYGLRLVRDLQKQTGTVDQSYLDLLTKRAKELSDVASTQDKFSSFSGFKSKSSVVSEKLADVLKETTANNGFIKQALADSKADAARNDLDKKLQANDEARARADQWSATRINLVLQANACVNDADTEKLKDESKAGDLASEIKDLTKKVNLLSSSSNRATRTQAEQNRLEKRARVLDKEADTIAGNVADLKKNLIPKPCNPSGTAASFKSCDAAIDRANVQLPIYTKKLAEAEATQNQLRNLDLSDPATVKMVQEKFPMDNGTDPILSSNLKTYYRQVAKDMDHQISAYKNIVEDYSQLKSQVQEQVDKAKKATDKDLANKNAQIDEGNLRSQHIADTLNNLKADQDLLGAQIALQKAKDSNDDDAIANVKGKIDQLAQSRKDLEGQRAAATARRTECSSVAYEAQRAKQGKNLNEFLARIDRVKGSSVASANAAPNAENNVR